VLLVFARVEGTVGGDPVDGQRRPVQDEIRLPRRGPYCFGERGGEGGQEFDGFRDVAVGRGGPDTEAGRELGVGLSVAEVGESEQGLSARAQAPPPRADSAPTFSQAGGEEAEGRAGHVDAGRVDKHAKPLVETVLLVENPSTRGFTRLSDQPPSRRRRLEKTHC